MEQPQPTKELIILRDAGWKNQDFADILGLNYRTFCRRRKKRTLTEQHLCLLREIVGGRVRSKPRNVDKAGVYYLRPGSSAYVKIGFTTGIDQRTTTLQVGSPEPLNLIAWFPGLQTLEAIHHDRWKEQHYRGEWFYYDPLMDNSRGDTSSLKEDTPPDHDSLASLM